EQVFRLVSKQLLDPFQSVHGSASFSIGNDKGTIKTALSFLPALYLRMDNLGTIRRQRKNEADYNRRCSA
ncbi:MAG: hypothetical protein PHD35_13005, partial [Synergistaceae bacterium]|nr:hypothetical protein [Synergistaceae bacterium]